MRVFYGFEEVKDIKNPVVTTGNFDGVHYGHKVILKRLKKLAEQYKGESVLISFYPHPRKVLYPDTAGKDLHLITSLDEKIELLEKEGLDNLVLIEFTREFARIRGEIFIEKYISARLKPRVVVVGFNHHFGYRQGGDYSYLKTVSGRYGFKAEEIPEQEVLNETVSSTEIRKALDEGYIQRVNAYLDHYYFVSGRCTRCEGLDEFNGSTGLLMKIVDEDKLLPLAGAYAVSVTGNGLRTRGLALVPENTGVIREVAILLFETSNPAIDHIKPLKLDFHKRMSGRIWGDRVESFRVPGELIRDTRELIF